MSLAPSYVRPVPPVPDTWTVDSSARATSSAGGTAASLLSDWRSYFPDARLQALIEKALSANRDLRIAVQRVEQARATYGIRRADMLPTVSAGGGCVHLHAPGSKKRLTAHFWLLDSRLGVVRLVLLILSTAGSRLLSGASEVQAV
ncbi:TolC family protein [Paraburkholderia graminis]|uniref:TolC family protein n=1 Tax=Paraburkholderia graminis TaxID=60548 RepID=UPI0038B7A1BC